MQGGWGKGVVFVVHTRWVSNEQDADLAGIFSREAFARAYIAALDPDEVETWVLTRWALNGGWDSSERVDGGSVGVP
jgi:hypothetical protein